jgi:hypothetical protein
MRQDVVVCKIPRREVCAAEVLLESRLATKLSCCLQDSGGRSRAARSLLRNALGRKLSCCLQDRANGFFGPERAVVGDSVPQQPGAAGGNAASNPDSEHATSADCPGTPGGIQGQPRSSRGDNRPGAVFGSQARCKPIALADTSMAGRFDDSSGSAVRPYRRLSHYSLKNLETVIESYRVPADGPSFSYKTGRNASVLSWR